MTFLRLFGAALLPIVVLLLAVQSAPAAPPCQPEQPCQHLPIVVGGSGAPPTATPAPTATPIPVVLWPNGDFESGIQGWAFAGQAAIISAVPPPVVARSGERVVALQSAISTSIELHRGAIDVPTDATYLSYWIWIRSTETNCGDDVGSVSIELANDTHVSMDRYDVCALTQTSTWVERRVNFTTYAGQTVHIRFSTGTSDSLLDSIVFIDDIGWGGPP